MQFLQNEWWLFAFSILGMIAHILKRNVTGESFVDIKNWFTYHPKSTILSMIATIAGFVIYMTQFKSMTGMAITTLDMGAVFAIGFMCESFFNKYNTEAPLK